MGAVHITRAAFTARVGVCTYSPTMRTAFGGMHMASLADVCSICDKSISLNDCKVDGPGNAVHGTCWAARTGSAGDEASRPWRQTRQLASEQNSPPVLNLSLQLSKAMAEHGMNTENEVSGHEKATDGQAPHGA